MKPVLLHTGRPLRVVHFYHSPTLDQLSRYVLIQHT